jgi:hypothetical protein
MPLKRVNLKEKKEEKEEITIFYNIRNKPKGGKLFIIGYLYYIIIN